MHYMERLITTRENPNILIPNVLVIIILLINWDLGITWLISYQLQMLFRDSTHLYNVMEIKPKKENCKKGQINLNKHVTCNLTT